MCNEKIYEMLSKLWLIYVETEVCLGFLKRDHACWMNTVSK